MSLTSVVLVFGSCTPKMFQGLNKADAVGSIGQTVLFHPGLKESLVYKTVISYKDRQFSALTYFNEVRDSVFKIVLLTSFGNTLLESEITKTDFVVKNVISYLDRRPILKLLEKDWRLMLAGNFASEVPSIFSSDTSEIIFHYGRKRINNLYHYNIQRKTVTGIESYKGAKTKAVISMASFQDMQPENFSIVHPSMKLKLNMTLLKKVSDDPPE